MIQCTCQLNPNIADVLIFHYFNTLLYTHTPWGKKQCEIAQAWAKGPGYGAVDGEGVAFLRRGRNKKKGKMRKGKREKGKQGGRRLTLMRLGDVEPSPCVGVSLLGNEHHGERGDDGGMVTTGTSNEVSKLARN